MSQPGAMGQRTGSRWKSLEHFFFGFSGWPDNDDSPPSECCGIPLSGVFRKGIRGGFSLLSDLD